MSTYSQTILTVALVTTLLTLLPSFSADTKLITETCMKVARKDYDLCLELLQSDPKSAEATLEGLVEISYMQTRKKYLSTLERVKAMAKSSKFDAWVKGGLEDCSVMYSEAETLYVEALKAFKVKDYATANTHAGSACLSPSDCEEGFFERKGETSPLTEINKQMVRFCDIALGLTALFP